MRRVAGSLLCAVVLLAGACVKQEAKRAAGTPPVKQAVTGTQTYTIGVDQPSPDGKQYQFSAFYPRSVRVRPGDTVVFDNRSTLSIHTVTFGVKADRSNQPHPLDKGETNPAVFVPCYTPSDPKPDMTSCETTDLTKGGGRLPAPAYGGTGYWNSGVLPFAVSGAPNPPPAEARRATVKLADSIAPGSYPFVCLLHPFMNGLLEVVGTDADRASPGAVAKAGAGEYEMHEAAAGTVAEPKVATEAGRTTVTAGAGDKVASVNRFFPPSVTVKAGDTVVWTNDGAYEPHTVTFQGTFQSPLDKGALVPGGVATDADFPGGYAHSGLFGPKPEFPSDRFSLRFTKKGSYPYNCILHPGMGGVVHVE
jgi:plastocyanin